MLNVMYFLKSIARTVFQFSFNFFKTWFEMFLLFDHITFKILFKSNYNSSCITEICFTTKVKYFYGYSVV